MSGPPLASRQIFETLIGSYPPSQWEDALRKLCRGNADLQGEVRELLQAYLAAQQDGFIETPAKDLIERGPVGTTATVTISQSETDFRQIGPYEIKRPLGTGAFASVYLAEQREPLHRDVAIKVFRWTPGPDSQHLLLRFKQEQEVLALLDHPNIAAIYDAGLLEDGRPYYAMEWVRGGRPLTTCCDELQLSIAQRLALFQQVCEAVAHAHQKGIIHRDLKPGNILVFESEGHLRVKVIDFGLAKGLQRRLLPASAETVMGTFFGTPAYMPPEQAGGDPLTIDTRADIYSLGAVLYELLTGLPPLDLEAAHGNLLEQIRIIREVEPLAPSARLAQIPDLPERARHRATTGSGLLNALRGDLDWIVLKCLEKQPARRYSSVGELQADIARHIRNEAVSAAPPSTLYRLQKFARRHSKILIAVVSIVLALLIGLLGTLWALVQVTHHANEAERQRMAALSARDAERQARMEADIAAEKAVEAAKREQKARQDAELQRRLIQRKWYAARMRDASQLVANGSFFQLPQLLRETARASPPGEDLRGFEWFHFWLLGEETPFESKTANSFEGLDFSPTGELLVTAGHSGVATLWNAKTGEQICDFVGHGGRLTSATFSPDGKRIVTASIDGTARVWDVQTGSELAATQRQPGAVNWATFSPDGATIATAGEDQTVRLWNARTGEPVGQPLRGHTGEVYVVGFSPRDSHVLASVGADATVRFWSLHLEPRLSLTVQGKGGQMASLAFSYDGRYLASGDDDGYIYLWDAVNPQPSPLACKAGQDGDVFSVSFSPNGRWLATTGQRDGRILLWEVPTLDFVRALEGHWGWTSGAVFSPDSQVLATCGGVDGKIILYRVETGTPITTRDRGTDGLRPPAVQIVQHSTPVYVVGLLEGENLFCTGCGDGTVRFFDLNSGKEVEAVQVDSGAVESLCVSPDGHFLALGTDSGALLIYCVGHYDAPVMRLDELGVKSLAFSPDGTTMVCGLATGSLAFLDVPSFRERASLHVDASAVTAVSFSAQGELGAGCASGMLVLVDTRSRNIEKAVQLHNGEVKAVVFKPGSSQWATVSYDSRVCIGDRNKPLLGHLDSVECAAFSPDGQRLITGGWDQTIIFWDTESSEICAQIEAHQGAVYAVAVVSDGRTIVTASGDKTAKIWRAARADPLESSP